MSERILVGRITEAHGLRGEVKIASFTATAGDIVVYGTLGSADGTLAIHIMSHRVAKPGLLIAKLKGVTSREAAEKLAGVELYIGRDALPVPEDGEFYHADLIGLTAVTPAGEPLGEVISMQNFGAGDLLEIRLLPSRRAELVLFDTIHVPQIDLANRKITISHDFDAKDEDETGPQTAN